MQYPKILGIDYGTKRIGIAISRGSLAQPLEVVDNQTDQESVVSQQALEKIEQICRAEQIEKIVLGLSENEMAKKTKKFASKLQKQVNLPVEFFDETLSSQEVEKKLKSQSIKKSKRSGMIDHYAAAEILQGWMEMHKIGL